MDTQQQYADAMRAFDAYYGARQATHGTDWPKRRYAEHRLWKVFLKIADKCARDGRDVERYVATVVTRFPKTGDALVPNDLLTARAEQIWTAHRSDRKVDAADKWGYFARLIIQIQAATGQGDDEILLTALNAQFPAWFRVLYPETMRDGILAAWGEEALEDLRRDRDLVRFLRAAMAGKMEMFERKMGVIDGI